ncbi:MAG: hypothetical protein AB2L21_02060 [Anaerolineaceae bacterium]|jgi:hypothetical protein
MTTNDERIKILTMLQEGKIDSNKAVQLLQALDNCSDPASSTQAGTFHSGSETSHKPRYLHIKVTRTVDNKSITDIRLPISVANAGIRIGAKFSPEKYGLDKDVLLEMMKSSDTQLIVDVNDEEDGEHVQIFLE